MSEADIHGGLAVERWLNPPQLAHWRLPPVGFHYLRFKSAAAAVKDAVSPAEDKVVWGACSVNCGSRCALRLHAAITKCTGSKPITRYLWRSSGARLPARTFNPSSYQPPGPP
jgi:hypothetical protein